MKIYITCIHICKKSCQILERVIRSLLGDEKGKIIKMTCRNLYTALHAVVWIFFFDCLWQNLKVILIFCIFMLNSHWGFRVLNKKTTVRRNPNNNLFALLMYKQQTECWGHKFSWKINMYFIFSCTRKNKAIQSYQYRCAIASEAYFNDS